MPLPLTRKNLIDDALLETQLQEVRAKRDGLKAQIEALAPSLDAPDLTDDPQRAIRAFTDDLRRGLNSATFDEKRRVLRLLVDRIEISPDAKSGTLYSVIPLPQQDSTGSRLGHRRSPSTSLRVNCTTEESPPHGA